MANISENKDMVKSGVGSSRWRLGDVPPAEYDVGRSGDIALGAFGRIGLYRSRDWRCIGDPFGGGAVLAFIGW